MRTWLLLISLCLNLRLNTLFLWAVANKKKKKEDVIKEVISLTVKWPSNRSGCFKTSMHQYDTLSL